MNETPDICPACGGYGKGQRACSCSREVDANRRAEPQRGTLELRPDVGKAITRLRHIEWRIGEYLHEGHARELTASVDALVWALRRQGVLT